MGSATLTFHVKQKSYGGNTSGYDDGQYRRSLFAGSLAWVVSQHHPVDLRRDPVPLAVFEQGCLYRNRAIHALETAGRTWRIAYSSPNLAGIQAAVSVGLGVSILPDVAVLKGHRMLRRKDGFPPVANTELALILAPDATSGTRRLAGLLAQFCGASVARDAEGAQISRQRRVAAA
jgi:DNA-binding transcriptional LysR family regulator